MYRPNEKLLDIEWLKDQYEIQQKSMRTIAKDLGVTTAVVSKYVKRYGLSTRSAAESKSITSATIGPVSYKKNKCITKDFLEKEYKINGKSLRLISKEFGLHRSLIKKALKHFQIPVRDLVAARQNRTQHGRTKRAHNPLLYIHKDEIIASYKNGESIRSIRHRLGLSRDSLYKFLVSSGIQIRTSSQANIGRRHSSATKNKMSKTASDQIVSGKRSSHSQGKHYHCMSPNQGRIRVRSSWERDYADYLYSNNINFYYEHKQFPLSNGKIYVPDFYLPSTDEFIEIKGFLSEDQAEKYKLFANEYPHLSWRLLKKQDLRGILRSGPKKKVYVIAGIAGSGKSWVCSRLESDPRFHYISYDKSKNSDHMRLIGDASDSKYVLYDLSVKISTFIKNYSHKFDIHLVCILGDFITVKNQLKNRGGKITASTYKRWNIIKKRAEQYAEFIGSSRDVLAYMRNVDI